ncbi:hypothetical protein NX059_002630 [Plenodomus lindquistii]|nr:hypothetical protein NX059_002630 [Plenodomus lindquistii]
MTILLKRRPSTLTVHTGKHAFRHQPMDATKDTVDAAAQLLRPYIQSERPPGASSDLDVGDLVKRALHHLKAINTADLEADPNAPYDISLAGVVYGLLDMIVLLGIIPHLSPGVAFSQRPKSVLSVTIAQLPRIGENRELLAAVIDNLVPILDQNGSGVQPLLCQRVLPDIVTALAELSYSPETQSELREKYQSAFQKFILEMPTSQLLPILTSLLQQPLPPWLKPIVSRELSIVPLRERGVRHIIEFLSLSYLHKNSQVPQDISGPQSQIPIPLEAISQASRLLAVPPTGTNRDDWLRALAPELFDLLDGAAGKELVRAAGQIMSEGILSKKTTGAPGTLGWELIAMPIMRNIYPKQSEGKNLTTQPHDGVIVQDLDLKLSLQRLIAIVSSSSHAGLMKRLVGPLLLPLWALLNFAKARPSLDREWTGLPQAILSHYMSIGCDARYIDKIALNLFWDGDAFWNFGPGSHGGVEIRRRSKQSSDASDMDSTLARIGELNTRTELLSTLLAGAEIPDATAGTIFVQVTARWLLPRKEARPTLTHEPDVDLLAPLIDAKLSEVMATKFRDQLARSPRHVIELMSQLIHNAVASYGLQAQNISKSKGPSRAMFENIFQQGVADADGTHGTDSETVDDDLVSYALSILNTLVSSRGFTTSSETVSSLHALLPCLAYLAQRDNMIDIPPLIQNSASELVQVINASNPSSVAVVTPSIDPLSEHRAALRIALAELTSGEPPNRAWALNTVHSLIRDPITFPILDVPSLTHTLFSFSLADPEPYVHTAAAPVLLSLAIRAPTFVVKIATEAFLDVDEVSLKLERGKQTKEKERAVQESLDFRLRVGELVSTVILSEEFWLGSFSDAATRRKSTRRVLETCLALASRRGQRTQTRATRVQISTASFRTQEDTEAAWGGPVPNVLEPEGRDPKEQAEIDALSGILNEWENTGAEEDVRIRTSALSVLSTLLEHRLDFVRQAMVDASLQMVLTMLIMETSEGKATVRRAGILVLLGLLRGLDTALEEGKRNAVDMSIIQQREVERVTKWVRGEDVDALARDHAASVVEGLETLRMKKMYKVRDEGLRLGPNLELQGGLRGLDITPGDGAEGGNKRVIVEEVE